MATVTKAIAYIVDDANGLGVEVQIDYSDTALRVEVLRVVNNGTRPLSVTAIRQSDGRLYQGEFPPARTTEIAVPQTGSGRFDISVDAQGRLLGIEYAIRWVVV